MSDWSFYGRAEPLAELRRIIKFDLVALDESNRKVRSGCCKRSSGAHELAVFERHIEAFLQTQGHRHLAGWAQERVLFCPVFSEPQRAWHRDKGYATHDLVDYAQCFGNAPDATRRV